MDFATPASTAAATAVSLICDHLGAILVSILSLYLAINAVYQLVFSPLSAIPGPWYAAISNFWLTTHVDIVTSKSIYTVHKFDKSSYYKSLLTNNNDHAMTTLPHGPHAIRKKGYAPHYTPTNLALFQPEMNQYAVEVAEILDNISGRTSVDCLDLFRQLLVDVSSATAFGYRVAALSKWAIDTVDPLSTAIGDFPKRGILRSVVPSWTWDLICRIPNNRWRQMCNSDGIMAQFVSARVYETRSQMRDGKMDEHEKVPLLQRLLRYRVGPSDELMSDQDIISEQMGHLVAGVDTTSTTLSYLCWELSRRADITRNLQAELDHAMPDSRVVPDINVLQKLPYLNAFVKEGLRIYSAVPSLLERVVPASTTKNGVFSETFDLMGFELPAGTVVATQGWSMHRDPSVFPSPDTFLPDRWLETPGNADQLARMAQFMMPFGTGSRQCGGQNFAQIMLRIMIAVIARNFDVITPSETNEKSMEIRDSFVVFPASMSCRLMFSPRKHQ
ncbi:hypothetical protein EVG20_g5213 [Dentipellis fragilis]|uniref:Cytochrome P450 n=1 Tax=Dentipellis fragilis TaxID=205917 RepID=A0A4Y9YXM4_9AGAM|nr:hypothetical protein EVG20_g5213 [Dentipellis fragilis]